MLRDLLLGLRIRSGIRDGKWYATYRCRHLNGSSTSTVSGCDTREEAVTELRAWLADDG